MLPVIVLLGPTCTGKSAAAMRLAAELGGEIVSCDSMQIYRGLEIGTAQPTAAERAAVRHHLVGELEIQERWDASRFVPAAQARIAEIQGRGKAPLVVGGTGLYARALCYGLPLLPGDAALAAELRAAIGTLAGVAALRAELEGAFGAEVPEDIRLNPRHLARAVEVYRLTGEAPWRLQRRPDAPLAGYRQYCVLPEFGGLKERIRRRTAAMLSAGWVAECEAAVAAGLLEAPTAWQALGYRDIAAFLAAGRPGGEGALRETLSNRTIQYARRQLTWFRHQHPGSVALPCATADEVAQMVLEDLSKQGGCA